MADTTDLQAQLKALEEQLQRKRLEEEIAHLQLQLVSASKGSGSLSNSHRFAPAVAAQVDDDEEYEEEEYTEEYVEDEMDEAVIVEIEPARAAPGTPSQANGGAVPPQNKRQSVQPVQQTTTGGGMLMPKVRSAAPAHSKTAPRCTASDTSALYDELRELEEELKRKQLEEELKAPEQQAASMQVADGTILKQSLTRSASPSSRSTSSVAEPSAPFKQRVIPNIQASPAGQETPMELLLGPKLYKNGKLVATTTRAGCESQQIMLLFFAASWNRLCKPFFPKLLDFYKLVNQPHAVECIYVSTDRNLNEFKEAFAKMPYLAMPTGTADYKNRIAKELKILEVPFLVVLDVATAQVITTNGMDLVDRLERGNWEQANALVEDWKRATPVPLDQVQLDTRLVNGVMERGILYWHN
ncbi:hypothetical protein MPSEU_000736400 [Mayamaea pseudoterrestris]|nr:hypothetical protein MPSEU_000736400 [Mayamaea pseudoterrestris]